MIGMGVEEGRCCNCDLRFEDEAEYHVDEEGNLWCQECWLGEGGEG